MKSQDQVGGGERGVLRAAGKGASFAARGGQLSGCEMGREIGRAVIATDHDREETGRPGSRARGVLMSSPRYESVSSL